MEVVGNGEAALAFGLQAKTALAGLAQQKQDEAAAVLVSTCFGFSVRLFNDRHFSDAASWVEAVINELERGGKRSEKAQRLLVSCFGETNHMTKRWHSSVLHRPRWHRLQHHLMWCFACTWQRVEQMKQKKKNECATQPAAHRAHNRHLTHSGNWQQRAGTRKCQTLQTHVSIEKSCKPACNDACAVHYALVWPPCTRKSTTVACSL
jgi:hypothetical protein